MYYPYFRGKQFELLAIRESAEVIAKANFTPIIEPVRASFTNLQRTLQELREHDSRAAVIINPFYGDLKHNEHEVVGHLEEYCSDNAAVLPAVLLTDSMSANDVISYISHCKSRPVILIHAGFTDGKGLAAQLPDTPLRHVFLEAKDKTLYRRHFADHPNILIEDGFKKHQRNADYPQIERFSDLHITYKTLGADGYGDFLTIGDHFMKGGGPAYAIAIHLTYIDPDQDDSMFVYHFVSDANDTPVDPAGKFSQALEKLVARANSQDSNLVDTSALKEFRDLHSRGHYPGLGYVKKLSLKHHLETLEAFHSDV